VIQRGLLHVTTVVGKDLAPRPRLPAEALFCGRRRARRGRQRVVADARRVAGEAAVNAAAAGADGGAAVFTGGVVAMALDVVTNADAGDEEAAVGRGVDAGGVDGDVAGPAQQRAVLEAEEVARLLLQTVEMKKLLTFISQDKILVTTVLAPAICLSTYYFNPLV
jgi:hypothetical protein